MLCYLNLNDNDNDVVISQSLVEGMRWSNTVVTTFKSFLILFWKELIDKHKFDADADADEDVVDAEVGAREGKGGKCNNCQIFSSGKEIFSGKKV